MVDYSTSLFIFRRDLRINDNTALLAALRRSERVIPCFVFDPRQIEAHPYQSIPGLQFMLESLRDLQRQFSAIGVRLALFQALPEQVIKQMAGRYRIQAVFVNRDYTPFSRQRDEELSIACKQLGIAFHVLPDYLLTEPERALKRDNTVYKVFTAFYKQARRIPVAMPQALIKHHFVEVDSGWSVFPVGVSEKPAAIKGGREQALMLLEGLENLADYNDVRDFPALNGTTRLSPHLKFGTCSVREVYYAVLESLGPDHPLLRQLYWRDFFTHIAYYFPQVFGLTFLPKFASLQWENNLDYFQAWCEGRTGFPIVDAGMRELNQTGFMHNRVRMIAASLLVKDLHIDWRWGECYFARHLIDYDPCVNNGNWQWVASTGCDAQPYFRVFNPWLQQRKFDRDCRYIYTWLPELGNVPVSDIHRWDKKYCLGPYPAPIVDHETEIRITKAEYKAIMLG